MSKTDKNERNTRSSLNLEDRGCSRGSGGALSTTKGKSWDASKGLENKRNADLLRNFNNATNRTRAGSREGLQKSPKNPLGAEVLGGTGTSGRSRLPGTTNSQGWTGTSVGERIPLWAGARDGKRSPRRTRTPEAAKSPGRTGTLENARTPFWAEAPGGKCPEKTRTLEAANKPERAGALIGRASLRAGTSGGKGTPKQTRIPEAGRSPERTGFSRNTQSERKAVGNAKVLRGALSLEPMKALDSVETPTRLGAPKNVRSLEGIASTERQKTLDGVQAPRKLFSTENTKIPRKTRSLEHRRLPRKARQAKTANSHKILRKTASTPSISKNRPNSRFLRNELEPKKKSKFKKLSLDCFSQGPPHKNLNRDNSIFPWEMIKSTAMNEKKPRRKRIRRPLLIGICLICFIALIVVVVVAARATTSGTTGDMAFGKNRHAYLISGPLANWCPNYDRKEVAPGTFQVRLDVSHIQKFVLDQTVYLHLIAAMTLDLGPQRGEYNSSHSVFLAFIIPIRGAAMVFVLDYSSKTLKKLAIKANPAQFAASIGERLPREPQGTPFLRNDGQRGLIGVRFNMDYRERLLHVWVCPGNFKEFTNECTIRTEYKVLPPKVRDPMHASFYTVFGVLGPDTTGKKGCVAFDINVKRVFEHYGCELLQEQNLGRYARICHDAAGNPYQCSENVPYKNLTKKK